MELRDYFFKTFNELIDRNEIEISHSRHEYFGEVFSAKKVKDLLEDNSNMHYSVNLRFNPTTLNNEELNGFPVKADGSSSYYSRFDVSNLKTFPYHESIIEVLFRYFVQKNKYFLDVSTSYPKERLCFNESSYVVTKTIIDNMNNEDFVNAYFKNYSSSVDCFKNIMQLRAIETLFTLFHQFKNSLFVKAFFIQNKITNFIFDSNGNLDKRTPEFIKTVSLLDKAQQDKVYEYLVNLKNKKTKISISKLLQTAPEEYQQKYNKFINEYSVDKVLENVQTILEIENDLKPVENKTIKSDTFSIPYKKIYSLYSALSVKSKFPMKGNFFKTAEVLFDNVSVTISFHKNGDKDDEHITLNLTTATLSNLTLQDKLQSLNSKLCLLYLDKLILESISKDLKLFSSNTGSTQLNELLKDFLMDIRSQMLENKMKEQEAKNKEIISKKKI